MTEKQFNKHKWAIGDVLWSITRLNVFDWLIPYRMIQTKVTEIYSHTDKDGTTVEKIRIEPIEDFEKYECLYDDFGYIYHNSPWYTNFHFLSKKKAEKVFDKERNKAKFIEEVKRTLERANDRKERIQDDIHTLQSLLENGL